MDKTNDKTILVIDTDTESIQMIMSALEVKGYLVFTASDKDVSIKMAEKIKPSLIFVNIGMSGTSGLGICKAIHDTEKLKDIPIVIITPHEGATDSRYKTLYGIVDSLIEPFDQKEIILKTNNVLNIKSVISEPSEEEFEFLSFEEEEKPVEDQEVEVYAEEKSGISVGEEIEVLPIEEGDITRSFEEIDIQPVEEEKSGISVEDEIKELSIEEEIPIQPFEEKDEGVLEKRDAEESVEEKLKMESFKEDMSGQPSEDVNIEISEEEKPERIEEEKIGGYSLREDITPQGPEEKMDINKDEEPEIPDKGKQEIPDEIPVEEDELRKMLEEAEDKEAVKPIEELEEMVETAAAPPKRDSLYRTSRRKTGKSNKFLIPVIAGVLLISGVAGFFLYKGLNKEITVKTPVVAKQLNPVQPPKPEPVQPQTLMPPKEQQKPQQLPPKVIPKPAPQVAAVKPALKPFYAVQIGAYKNEANAISITEKYKGKGYDAFTYKSEIKGKGTFYRVLIGKFNNNKGAAELAKSIRNKENITAVIFHE
jgi:cell division septation protein DedD/ActR/RegA family two-component response regulator